jgi:hypothetical protein
MRSQGTCRSVPTHQKQAVQLPGRKPTCRLEPGNAEWHAQLGALRLAMGPKGSMCVGGTNGHEVAWDAMNTNLKSCLHGPFLTFQHVDVVHPRPHIWHRIYTIYLYLLVHVDPLANILHAIVVNVALYHCYWWVSAQFTEIWTHRDILHMVQMRILFGNLAWQWLTYITQLGHRQHFGEVGTSKLWSKHVPEISL